MLIVITQMSVTLAHAVEKNVFNIAWNVGRYIKLSSSGTESVNGLEIFSYRGNIFNSPELIIEVKIPDPRRILEGYFRAAARSNLTCA